MTGERAWDYDSGVDSGAHCDSSNSNNCQPCNPGKFTELVQASVPHL